MDGKLVVVKMINPDCVADFNAFKHVCLSPSLKRLLSTPFYVRALTETVRSGSHLEATAASKCGRVPWVDVRLSSSLPRVPVAVQRKPVRVLTPAPRC